MIDGEPVRAPLGSITCCVEGCPFEGGLDLNYTLLLVQDIKLYFQCPCGVGELAAAHKALTSEGKQCILKAERGKTWHIEAVRELLARKEAKKASS